MNSSSTLIQILLATYNGERFLDPQIESLLAQTHRPIHILIRDDGSTDQTPALLATWASRHPDLITVLPSSTPTGSAKLNFIQLLKAATAPYIALCDQDDVWLPTKLATEMAAMQALERTHGAYTPLLVFTDLAVVNQDLSPRHPSFWLQQGIPPRKIHRFASLLTQNVVTGCTALMNAPLARLTSTMPPEAYMHDWWLALLVNAFGHATHLTDQTVLYRQHEANVLGAQEAGKSSIIPRFRYHDKRREQWETSAHTAQAFARLHGANLPPGKRAVLNAFLRVEQSPNPLVRVANFFRHGFFYNTFRGNLAMLWYILDMNAAKRQYPIFPPPAP